MIAGMNVDTGQKTWLTPPEIIRALGEFDLDPCCPPAMPWSTAKKMVCRPDDGLAVTWEGRVWLNPPYGRERAIRFSGACATTGTVRLCSSAGQTPPHGKTSSCRMRRLCSSCAAESSSVTKTEVRRGRQTRRVYLSHTVRKTPRCSPTAAYRGSTCRGSSGSR